jgi:hypothetical protein
MAVYISNAACCTDEELSLLIAMPAVIRAYSESLVRVDAISVATDAKPDDGRELYDKTATNVSDNHNFEHFS